MLTAMVIGQENPDELAGLAQGQLRLKIPQLGEALGAESVPYIASVYNNSCSESILWMSRLPSWKPKSKNRMPHG
jgi:hypothetical protein